MDTTTSSSPLFHLLVPPNTLNLTPTLSATAAAAAKPLPSAPPPCITATPRRSQVLRLVSWWSPQARAVWERPRPPPTSPPLSLASPSSPRSPSSPLMPTPGSATSTSSSALRIASTSPRPTSSLVTAASTRPSSATAPSLPSTFSASPTAMSMRTLDTHKQLLLRF